MHGLNHLKLGASLYIPATRDDLAEHANGEKLPGLRSMIFCTEDAVATDQVDEALRNLRAALPEVKPAQSMRFIRVRNPHVMGRVLEIQGIENIDGFVLPKVTRRNIRQYLNLLTERDKFCLMPTLETAEAYDPFEMRKLRDILMEENVRSRILCLRIGGNDLLHQIGVRRSPRRTIYHTALGGTISMLTGLFSPFGFHLSAPVFEGLAHPKVLRREVRRDMDNGLMAKTAIHPTQIKLIEDCYRPTREEFEMAQEILAEGARPVFRMHDTMCEGATHWRSAEFTVARARIYGIAEKKQRLERAHSPADFAKQVLKVASEGRQHQRRVAAS